MKKLFELLTKGISAALSFFTVFGVLFDISNGGTYIFQNWSYTKMVVGAIVVGIGFAIPGLIYENTSLSYAIKVLIHMGIGCTILLITGFVVGWIPTSNGQMACMIAILAELLTAFILWICFSCYNKKMARKMNERIKDMNK